MRASGPCSRVLATSRVAFIDDSTRASTAAPIVLTTTAFCAAFISVHWPVPFWPALSRMTSTIGAPVSGSRCARMRAVISIR